MNLLSTKTNLKTHFELFPLNKQNYITIDITISRLGKKWKMFCQISTFPWEGHLEFIMDDVPL